MYEVLTVICYSMLNSKSGRVTFLLNSSLRENSLNTILYIPVYGLPMPIYGNNPSQYGKIRDRIQAFFCVVLYAMLFI